jgi:hypothetical protein
MRKILGSDPAQKPLKCWEKIALSGCYYEILILVSIPDIFIHPQFS